MSVEEPRPETPQEYDRRVSAALDFDPGCDVEDCEQRGSQGARCRACKTVLMVLCGAHAGRAERQLRAKTKPQLCKACGTPTGDRSELIEMRPLAGWF